MAARSPTFWARRTEPAGAASPLGSGAVHRHQVAAANQQAISASPPAGTRSFTWLGGKHQCSARPRSFGEGVLDKADQLRLVRNPFAHLKSSDREYNLDRRAFRVGADPEQILESDAKDAIIAMYAAAMYAFPRGGRI